MSIGSELRTTEVDLSGLLQVLGTNLYSSPEVAVRELVQNAHDACSRRRLESPDAPPARIVVGASPASRRIWVEDNGAGLTREEMQRYLATIGAGYTRVLRGATGDSGLIGAFGLGFLSAYMIGKRVEVVSASFTAPEQGVRFVSDSGRTYSLESVAARPVGARVEIELNEACAHLADFGLLARVLRDHCRLLGAPVVLEWSGEVINDLSPPWRGEVEGAPPVRLRRDRMAFAEAFETYFEPVCTLPITRSEADDPGAGLLWIHDSGTYGSLDNRRLSVFVRGMRVRANERDLLPSWAGFVGGVYEAETLVPTASREDLQHDAAYRAAGHQIARDLALGLVRLAEDEPEVWRRVLRRHNEALLGAAVADDRVFAALKDVLTLPTTLGDLTADEIARRSPGGLYVGGGDERGAEAVLARAAGSPVVDGRRYGASAFAARWAREAGVPLLRTGGRAALDRLFPEASVAPETRSILQAWFGEDVALRLSRFAPTALPLLVVTDEDAETKAFIESDEADARIGAGVLAMARLFTESRPAVPARTVVINLDCEAVSRLLASGDPVRGAAAARLLSAAVGLLGAGRDSSSAVESLSALSAALSTLLEP